MASTGRQLDLRSAAALIRPRDTLICGFVPGQPIGLLEAIGARADLEDVVLYSGLLARPYALLRNPGMRVVDVDFGRHQIVVRSGKGDEDRVTMLPATVRSALATHLARARDQHQRDLAQGAGWVELPGALARKLPAAGRDWAWQ